MAKHNICSILIVFTLAMAMQIKANHAGEEDDLLREYSCLKSEKLAKIHFYVQDVVGGPNATVYEVARASISNDSLLSFGKIFVVDDVVTAAPSANSEELGKSEGIFTSADRDVAAMAMNFNFAFTSGKYNGSTLSIAGRNVAFDRQRSLAVVGGTGVFRYTRGHAMVSTYSLRQEDSASYAVLEYTIYATFCEWM